MWVVPWEQALAVPWEPVTGPASGREKEPGRALETVRSSVGGLARATARAWVPRWALVTVTESVPRMGGVKVAGRAVATASRWAQVMGREKELELALQSEQEKAQARVAVLAGEWALALARVMAVA